MTDWTTPEDIKAQVRQDWDRGRILVGRLNQASIYPKPVRFKRPDSKSLGAQFGTVQDWIAALVQGSRTERGRGFEIEWDEFKHHQLGRNRIPKRVVIPSDEDAAFLIGKLHELKKWDQLVSTTLASFPALQPWLQRRPLAAIEAFEDWDRILAVLSWFVRNPDSGLFLRQLDIEGVDTKFVETRRSLFGELLERALPTSQAAGIDSTGATLEARYGLRERPIRVRFRFLDPSMSVNGLTDIEADSTEFARQPLPVDRVIVVENEINFLSFPPVPSGLVIWGGGYAVDRIEGAGWLSSRQLLYWGDIDTHGFGILGRMRSMFPGVRSFLMDRDTLIAHRGLCVTEAKPRNDHLAHLTTEEASFYDDLRRNRIGQQLRLEQERIRFGAVVEAVRVLPRLAIETSWVDAARTRNWLLDDPLLDWLDRFGAERGFVRDDAYPGYDRDLDFRIYATERATAFRDRVLRALAETMKPVSITADTDDARASATLGRMNDGAELIVDGLLRNARRSVSVNPSLLMRADVAERILPPGRPTRLVAPVSGRPRYIPVYILWRRLELDREGRLAAARDHLPELVEAWCAADALGEVLGYVPTPLMIGRPPANDSARFTVARVGIERGEHHQSFAAAADEALNWLRRLRTNGHEWSPLPTPSLPELYPHARNRADAPWRRAKKQLSHSLRELTLLPAMNPERRRFAHALGIHAWTDPRASAPTLGIPTSRAAERLDVVLHANRDATAPLVPVHLDANAPWRAQPDAEFFVDFEMAHDDEDSAIRRIAMVGCGRLQNGTWQFTQWIADALTDQDERQVLDAWIMHMRRICEVLPGGFETARIVHWSNAERSAFTTAFDAARTRLTPNNWPDGLPWFDLLEVFRAEPIGVKGAFDYGLKSIANAMHAAGLIETRWDDASLDGLGAMVGITRASEQQQPLTVSNLVQRIAGYNETDCRVLMEILGWLRAHR